MLDLSKIEAGKLELNPQTVQLAPLIDEVIGTARQLAEQNKNRLVVEAQENLGTLTVDPMRLRQILLNLLSNACKFTKEGEVALRGAQGKQRRPLDRAVGLRYRHRHDGGATGEAVRGIQPGRCHDSPALRRHRTGPRHHPQARPHDGRRRHGDERAGQRLSLHGAAAGRGRYLSKAELRSLSHGPCLYPAEADIRRPRRWSGYDRCCRKRLETGLGAEAEHNPDRKPPKVISPSDPCSAWTAKANKRVQFGYGLNYLIDIENTVIVDVEATPARTYDEVAATKSMIERTDKRFGLKPKRLAADTAYGTGKFLGWLIGAGITPHIPVWDKSTREDGTLSRSDFQWDKRRGVYVCPNNKVLHTSGTVHDGRTLLYRASKLDCDACALKARCCPKQLARKIPRDVHEDARDVARQLMGYESLLKVA